MIMVTDLRKISGPLSFFSLLRHEKPQERLSDGKAGAGETMHGDSHRLFVHNRRNLSKKAPDQERRI